MSPCGNGWKTSSSATARQIARQDDTTLLTAGDEEVQHTATENTDFLMTNSLVLFKSVSGAREWINARVLSKMGSKERAYKEAGVERSDRGSSQSYAE